MMPFRLQFACRAWEIATVPLFLTSFPRARALAGTRRRTGRRHGATAHVAAVLFCFATAGASATEWPEHFSLPRLDGTDGFQMRGHAEDNAGKSISAAGDVNGDGFDDALVSAPGYDHISRETTGTVFVVFGNRKFDRKVDLPNLPGRDGFTIVSAKSRDAVLGAAVSGAGDINRDRYADILVSVAGGRIDGAPVAAGVTYVVFGSAHPNSIVVVEALDGKNGFRLIGEGAQDEAGASLAAAGDVNGDGFEDFVVGAPQATTSGRSSPGAAYVIFGRKRDFLPSYDLGALDGQSGFRIVGHVRGDEFGASVAGAGDLNGDGYDDIAVGAPMAKVPSGGGAGAGYVIFGRSSFESSMSVEELDGRNGFRIDGAAPGDRAGTSVAIADLNCDGYDDIAIGAPYASRNRRDDNGGTFVVFGQKRFGARVLLADIAPHAGFRIEGEGRFDRSGSAVASAGDVDGDKCDDILVGAPGARPSPGQDGAAYLVFGHTKSFPSYLDLAKLKDDAVIRFSNAGRDAGLGASVAGAGDLDGDGIDDMLIGAPYAGRKNSAGSVYAVFGH